MRGKVVWEGDHLRPVLTATDIKIKVLPRNTLVRYHPFYVKLVVDVFWMSQKEWCIRLHGQLVCSNRFESLSVVEPVEHVGSGIECSGDSENVHVDLNRVRENVLAGNRQERKLRVGTWSERKQKEVGELLKVNNTDVAGQESWEKEDSRINVDG